MRSKILNPEWFYDILTNALTFTKESFEEDLRKCQLTDKEFERTLREIQERKARGESIHPLMQNDYDVNLQRSYINKSDIKEMTQDREVLERVLREMKESKPFLIGAATLESLVNETPKSYECIEKEKLPFDNMFFEFSEPIELEIPFLEGKYDARGMQLKKRRINDKEGSTAYDLSLLYQKNHVIMSTNIIVKLGHNPFFVGCINTRHSSTKELSPSDEIGLPKITRLEYEISENGIVDICRGMDNIRRFHNDEIDPKLAFSEHIDIKSIPNNQIFTQLPNLAVNLINYINAHNVTVIRKDRPVVILTRNQNNKKKKITTQQPFHLIVLRDQVYEEPDTPREIGKWVLEYRVFVRGHDRKYLDDRGAIRMTSWIPPCIKGPPNAPFIEQRYQVLHDKLKREQEMYKKYGVHQYSSDLTMPGSSHGNKR